MVEDLGGEEAFRQAYQAELDHVQNTMDLAIHPEAFQETAKRGDGSQPKEIGHWRIVPQKQEGLYAVFYHPVGGCPDLKTLEELQKVLEPMQDVELRSSPDQSIYIINLTGSEADRVLEITEADCARNEFESSVACVGAGTCLVGVRDSQKMLHELIKAVREAGIPDGCLPKMHISGCPSFCSAQQTAEIGLRGTVKVMPDKEIKPAYFLSLHGKNGRCDSRMGIEAGRIREDQMAPFLIRLGTEVKESGMDYGKWAEKNPGRLDEIAAVYSGDTN